MLHFLDALSGGNIAFLREEGGTRQGFPEANEMSFGGSLRSVTEGARVTLCFVNFIVTHSPSVAYGDSSLPEGASGCSRLFSCYSA